MLKYEGSKLAMRLVLTTSTRQNSHFNLTVGEAFRQKMSHDSKTREPVPKPPTLLVFQDHDTIIACCKHD